MPRKTQICLLTVHVHVYDGRQRRLPLSERPTTGIDFSVRVFPSAAGVDASRATVGYDDRVLLVVVEVIPCATSELGVQIATRQPRQSQVYLDHFLRTVASGGR